MMSRSDKFFIKEEDSEMLLRLHGGLIPFIHNETFIAHFKGMIDIRKALYYRANYD